MARLGTLLALLLALPAAAEAQDAQVLARLPLERRAEVMAALRVELAGRATLIEGGPPGEEATDASMRAEANGATHVVWVVFPGGMLAPAEVRVLDVTRPSAARAMTAQAWDVVEARVVAVLAASLLEPAPVVVAAEAAPPPAEVVDAPEAATPAAEIELLQTPTAPDAPLALREPQVGRARPARTFSLWFGLGIAHTNRLRTGQTVLPSNQVGFYARLSDWASIGLRLRGGFGLSSIEGAIIDLSIGLPSFAVSFRESLGTAAAIELGVHVEGGLSIDWHENRTWREDQLSFGLGFGAFAALELGRANGVMLDYTLEIYGLGGLETWIWGGATLSYVHRWD